MHTEYVIFLSFAWQQWLHLHASVLMFTCTLPDLLLMSLSLCVNIYVIDTCLLCADM